MGLEDSGDTLEVTVGQLLRYHHLTLAAAESCTGGLFLHRLTNIPGSSDYILGGIVAYSNHAKIDLLHVHPQTLETYGAVSAETAAEMAHGARVAVGSRIGIGITGIAGPGGGTAEKPVGLTFIAFESDDAVFVRQFIWTGSREENKEASASAALQLVFDFLYRR